MSNLIYTGIGSRETPEWAICKIKKIGGYLYDKGYTLRSGGADGADLAFESQHHDRYEQDWREKLIELIKEQQL